MRAATFRTPSALPGFGLAFGITLTMLSILVIVPIGALLLRGVDIGAADIWRTIHTARVWTALRLSFGISFLAALFNLVFGLALAWVLGGDVPVIPVVGISSVAQLDEALGALELELDAETRARMDAAG